MNLVQTSARTDEMLDVFQHYWKLRISYSSIHPSIYPVIHFNHHTKITTPLIPVEKLR